MRVLIIDDEPAAIKVISLLANDLATDMEVIGTADNGLKAYQMILEKKPDLVFLDINMPFMDGMDVLEKLPDLPMEVILMTGTEIYALKALKLNVVDYLLKPIDPSEFLQAVEKARKRVLKRVGDRQVAQARLLLPTQNGIFVVEEAAIIQISGKGNYSDIFSVGAPKITISKSIGKLEDKLNPNIFFRCHNSHIINLLYAARFVMKDGYWIILKDGSQVEVSRRSKDELLVRLAALSP